MRSQRIGRREWPRRGLVTPVSVSENGAGRPQALTSRDWHTVHQLQIILSRPRWDRLGWRNKLTGEKHLMRSLVVAAIAIGLVGSLGVRAAHASSITLYGGNGGHNDGTSQNDGALVVIDQTNAAVTLVGQPGSTARLTGLAFDNLGRLWGSTLPSFAFPPPPPPSFSTLIGIDPNTGRALVQHRDRHSDGTVAEHCRSGGAAGHGHALRCQRTERAGTREPLYDQLNHRRGDARRDPRQARPSPASASRRTAPCTLRSRHLRAVRSVRGSSRSIQRPGRF